MISAEATSLSTVVSKEIKNVLQMKKKIKQGFKRIFWEERAAEQETNIETVSLASLVNRQMSQEPEYSNLEHQGDTSASGIPVSFKGQICAE